MEQLVLIIHVLVAIGVVALVLLQHGKGANAGASFGAGSSNTMMGSSGALPVMLKLTALLGLIFFATSLTLAHMAAMDKLHAKVIQMPAAVQSMPDPAMQTVPSKNMRAKDEASDEIKR